MAQDNKDILNEFGLDLLLNRLNDLKENIPEALFDSNKEPKYKYEFGGLRTFSLGAFFLTVYNLQLENGRKFFEIASKLSEDFPLTYNGTRGFCGVIEKGKGSLGDIEYGYILLGPKVVKGVEKDELTYKFI